MPSTILSSIGEPILHNNDLAIVTENWIVVRDLGSQSQALISIANLSRMKTHKAAYVQGTANFIYLASSAGAFLLAVATFFSKEGDGATLPFAFIGLGLLVAAQVTRQASIAFVVDSETVHTRFGSLSDAALLIAAVNAARGSKHPDADLASSRYWRVRAYVSLLV
jgi:hypothetical protein